MDLRVVIDRTVKASEQGLIAEVKKSNISLNIPNLAMLGMAIKW